MGDELPYSGSRVTTEGPDVPGHPDPLRFIAVGHSAVGLMGSETQTLSATGLARKTELVEMAGGLYTLAQVASLLNVSEEIVEDRHKAGMLIAVRSGGKYGYPARQFTSDGIVEGLAAILEAIPVRADWMRLEWLLMIFTKAL